MKTLREHDGELIKHWYILALENEVPKAKPIRRYLYDQAYVLFYNSKNEIQVLLDMCPHRGSQLSQGEVVGDNLVCPYHGWTFNGSGHLVNVPSDGPKAASETPRKQKCAHAPAVKVQDGCVWIWPHESVPLSETPPWRFPFHGNSKIKSYFMITDFENETDNLVQNFMDVPHTVFVHSKWFRKKTMLQVPIDIEADRGRVKVTYHQENDSIGFTDYILNPGREKMTHTDEFIFPNLTRVDYTFGNRLFIINSQCSPISRFQTRVYTWIAYDIGLLNTAMLPFLKYYTRKVITQDVDIMKNQGDNLKYFNEALPSTWRSTQADELHIAIDKIRNSGRIDHDQALELNFKREREFWI